MGKSSQRDRFNLVNVQQHEHGGIGSRTVAQPTFTYVGQILNDGTPLLLPNTWTVTRDGTAGDYSIVHNLGTNTYTCVASSGNNGAVATPVIGCDLNQVSFTWWEGTKVDTTFNFILAVVNNKVTTPPTYYVNPLLNLL